jgi:hypothetical protein
MKFLLTSLMAFALCGTVSATQTNCNVNADQKQMQKDDQCGDDDAQKQMPKLFVIANQAPTQDAAPNTQQPSDNAEDANQTMQPKIVMCGTCPSGKTDQTEEEKKNQQKTDEQKQVPSLVC